MSVSLVTCRKLVALSQRKFSERTEYRPNRHKDSRTVAIPTNMRNGGNYNQVSLHDSESSDDEDDIVVRHMRKQEVRFFSFSYVVLKLWFIPAQRLRHFLLFVTQLHLKRQDEGLEMLSQSAERLGKMSMTISEELGQQNQMLDEMDSDLGQASENLDMVTRKTRELIQKSGGQRTFVLIVGLILVVIILVFLILYT